MPNHLFVIHAKPAAAGITEETTYLLTRPDAVDDLAAQDAIDRLAAFWDMVNREDVAIVQRAGGARDDAVSGWPAVLTLRGAGPPLAVQGRRPMVGLRRVPPVTLQPGGRCSTGRMSRRPLVT